MSETEKQNAAPEGGAPSGDAIDPTKGPAPLSVAPDAMGTDKQLIALCVVLWIVVIAIILSSAGEMRVNYYLGNIKQTLDREGHLDDDSVASLAAMGDKALPQIVKDLETHEDPFFRVALLKVLERMPSEEARRAIAETCRSDGDPRVRANAIKILGNRAQKLGGPELEQAVACACDCAAKDPEWQTRAHAVMVLGDLKDPRAEGPLTECLKSHEEGLRKKAAEVLKKLEPEGPAFDAAGPEDLRARQAWEWENHLRKKHGQPLLAGPPAPISTATPAPVSTATPTAKNDKK